MRIKRLLPECFADVASSRERADQRKPGIELVGLSPALAGAVGGSSKLPFRDLSGLGFFHCGAEMGRSKAPLLVLVAIGRKRIEFREKAVGLVRRGRAPGVERVRPLWVLAACDRRNKQAALILISSSACKKEPGQKKEVLAVVGKTVLEIRATARPDDAKLAIAEGLARAKLLDARGVRLIVTQRTAGVSVFAELAPSK